MNNFKHAADQVAVAPAPPKISTHHSLNDEAESNEAALFNVVRYSSEVDNIRNSAPADNEHLPLLAQRASKYYTNHTDYMSDSAIYPDRPEWRPRQLTASTMGNIGRGQRMKKTPKQGPNRKGTRLNKRARARVFSREEQFGSQFPELRVVAYCTCDELDLPALMKWLKLTGCRSLSGHETSTKGWTTQLYLGSVHASLVPNRGPDGAELDEVSNITEHKDAFFFAWGCMVFWGMTPQQERDHLAAAARFSINPADDPEWDDMVFHYSDISRIQHDSIALETTDPLEKLSLSFAMAQSAKLDLFESRVEEVIEEYQTIPRTLSKYGKIHLTQGEISRMIGKIFLERADVNLNSEILDEPDFFWEYDEWEPLYKRMLKYLDVERRVEVLNARLDILKELLEVLNDQLQNQHASKLEWIVIWLIVAEVAVEAQRAKHIIRTEEEHSSRG